MTPVLVDTSALYAALDRSDRSHPVAQQHWHRLIDQIADGTVEAITHSGIVVETSALVQRRLGMEAARAFHDDLLPTIAVNWVTEDLHHRAVAALLAANRRDVSLVDWTSFELMRARGIRTAFAFDDDFTHQGFSSWVPE